MANFKKVGLLILFSSLIGKSFGDNSFIGGPSISVESIIVEGNSKTKIEIILRELTVFVDSSYSEHELIQQIQKSEWNLKNLNLFNKIVLSFEKIKKQDVEVWNLKVLLVEKWYIWPIPFVEFADRNINQWYQFNFDPFRTNYGLYLFKYNMFGKNQTLKVSLINGYNREAGIQYQIPWLWIFGKPNVGLDIDTKYRTNQEVWYKTDENKVQFFRNENQQLLKRFQMDLTLNIRPKLNFWHKPFLSLKNIRVADTIISSSVNDHYLLNGHTSTTILTLGYRGLYEKRNNKYFPTKGFFGLTEAAIVNLQEGNSYPYLSLEAGIYVPINTNMSWATHVVGRKSWAGIVPYSQMRALGYDQFVRGYEAYVVDGQSYALAQFEFRFHWLKERSVTLKYLPIKSYKSLPVESFVSLFADQGFVENTSTSEGNNLTNTHLLGYGIGLNTMFYYDKVFRFEYSFNKSGNGGLRVHFKRSF